MRLNENTKIIGDKVILIPYESKHVEKYHEWMKDPELQKLTASEPLSLEEEYEMQRSWRQDEDKCTFLILSKEMYEETNDEIQSLIGDTNLFIHYETDTHCDDDNDEDNTSNDGCNRTTNQRNHQINDKVKVGEAEIMIAEKFARGKHLGWEAMLLMLNYGLKFIKIQKFIVKIGMDNIKSINMFKKLKFIEIGCSNVFNEITLERNITNDWIEWLNEQIRYFECKVYNE